MPTRVNDLVQVLDLVEERVGQLNDAVAAINNHLKANAASIPETGAIGLPANPLPLPNPLPKLSGGRCMMNAPWDIDPTVDLETAAEAVARAMDDCAVTMRAVGEWEPGAPMSGTGRG